MLTWFEALPVAVQIVLGIVGLAVVVGVLLGLAQLAGLLPRGWSAERFRAWFERRRDDDD